MEAPAAQYVRTRDGYDIAYSVSGEGAPLVLLPKGLLDIRFAWHAIGPDLDALRKRFQLIQFDVRGRGLSSRGLHPDMKIEDVLFDLMAVVERLALNQFILLSDGAWGHLAIRYAARNPSRVRALILSNCAISRSAWSPSLFVGVAAENWDIFVRALLPHGVPPSEFQLWFDAFKQCATPEDWQVEQAVYVNSDVGEELPRIRVPTLVMHSQEMIFGPEHARSLAAGIPGARLALSDGAFSTREGSEGLAAIEGFLADIPGDPQPGRLQPAINLSRRQVEVLKLIAQGKTNREIAEELVLSERTVQRHIADLYLKIDVRNRAEAVGFARDHIIEAPA
jgi:DNA-binding CsgD family transcriptional regulator/pimeloyl-ACP methyl ester carboxylesterase